MTFEELDFDEAGISFWIDGVEYYIEVSFIEIWEALGYGVDLDRELVLDENYNPNGIRSTRNDHIISESLDPPIEKVKEYLHLVTASGDLQQHRK